MFLFLHPYSLCESETLSKNIKLIFEASVHTHKWADITCVLTINSQENVFFISLFWSQNNISKLT